MSGIANTGGKQPWPDSPAAADRCAPGSAGATDLAIQRNASKSFRVGTDKLEGKKGGKIAATHGAGRSDDLVESVRDKVLGLGGSEFLEISDDDCKKILKKGLAIFRTYPGAEQDVECRLTMMLPGNVLADQSVKKVDGKYCIDWIKDSENEQEPKKFDDLQSLLDDVKSIRAQVKAKSDASRFMRKGFITEWDEGKVREIFDGMTPKGFFLLPSRSPLNLCVVAMKTKYGNEFREILVTDDGKLKMNGVEDTFDTFDQLLRSFEKKINKDGVIFARLRDEEEGFEDLVAAAIRAMAPRTEPGIGQLARKVYKVYFGPEDPGAWAAERESLVEELRRREIVVLDTSEGLWFRGKQLGQGAFKTVYEAFHLFTGARQAFAEINTRLSVRDSEEVEKELQWSDLLDHSSFIKYHSVTYSKQDGEGRGLLSAYADGGDLSHKLSTLSSDEAAHFTHSMLEGIRYLQKNGIIHKDLKPANFLIIGGELTFMDYGLMQYGISDEPVEIKPGTFHYTPPESFGMTKEARGWVLNEKMILKTVAQGEETPKFDNYSAGMILLEMSTKGSFKISSLSPENIENFGIELIRSNPANPLASVIAGLINLNPAERMSIDEAMRQLGSEDQMKAAFEQPLQIPVVKIIGHSRFEFLSKDEAKQKCAGLNIGEFILSPSSVGSKICLLSIRCDTGVVQRSIERNENGKFVVSNLEGEFDTIKDLLEKSVAKIMIEKE